MKRILFLMIISFSFAFAWDIAKVVSVTDGDTLWLKKDNQKAFKVRLIAVDTFETKVNHRAFIQLETIKNINRHNKGNIKQVLKYGYKAKEWVEKRFLSKEVKYITFGKDRYGRVLVWIVGLNYGLVRRGLAIYYPNNLLSKKIKSFLLKASRDANLEKRGFYELR